MKNIKRTAALLLSLMLAASFGLAASAGTFGDVGADNVYAPAIELLSSLGVVAGDESGFRPGDNIKRSEFCKIVYVIYTGKSDASAFTKKSAFNDVADGAWYNGYVNWAVEKQIVGGMGDGSFAPDAPVTIEQAIKMLVVGILGAPENPVWPDTYLDMALKTGLGDGVDFSASNVPAKREQVAQLGCNAIFENSTLLGATPASKFFASAVKPAQRAPVEMFLAGSSFDTRGAEGMTAAGQIVLSTGVQFAAADAPATYPGSKVVSCDKDVSDMLSTWVKVVLSADGSRVVSIRPADKTVVAAVANGHTTAGTAYLFDKEVKLSSELANNLYVVLLDGKLYQTKADPATPAYLFHTSVYGGWNGVRTDEKVVYSFNSAGEIAGGVISFVQNAVELVEVTAQNVSFSVSGGSKFNYADVTAAARNAVTIYDGAKAGDFVDITFGLSYTGEMLYDITAARVIDRAVALTAVSKGATSFDVGDFIGTYHRSNNNSAVLDSGYDGKAAGSVWKLVLDRAGFVVYAVELTK